MRRLKQTGKSNEAEQELLSPSFVSHKRWQKMHTFTRPKIGVFSLGPKDAYFHSAQNIWIFTRPKTGVFLLGQKYLYFLLGPKYACFHSAKNVGIFTRSKIFVLYLAPKYLLFHSPQNICIFAWPKKRKFHSAQACLFSLSPKSSRTRAFKIIKVLLSAHPSGRRNWYDWNVTWGHTFENAFWWVMSWQWSCDDL